MHLLKCLLVLIGIVNARPSFSVSSTDQAVIKNNDGGFSTTDTVHDILIEHKIIPQVLDDFEPSYSVALIYPEHHDVVSMGNLVPVKHVSVRPVFTITQIRNQSQRQSIPADDTANKTYTLILTDPDAKSYSNPKWSEMCHWIITNITTSSLEAESSTLVQSMARLSLDSDLNLDLELEPTKHKKDKKGRKHKKQKDKKPQKLTGELMGYLPPSPPPKTGPHRYVFVLLEGDSHNSTDVAAPKDRKHWGYKGLRRGVRDWAAENDLKVVGVNFFYAQNKKQKHTW